MVFREQGSKPIGSLFEKREVEKNEALNRTEALPGKL